MLAKVNSYSSWYQTPWYSVNPATITLNDTAKYAIVVFGAQTSYDISNFSFEVVSGATQVGSPIDSGQLQAGWTKTVAVLIKDVSTSISIRLLGSTQLTPVFSVWKLL